ncbi:NAC domain-containing protein 1-like [Lycium barbarum]|uniref:NAC domain-containing protein 1-like n=1 Tax=Lycium barbarum TaxID=112863 RepID=UPI00293F7098|nr:NAC domain-containing protein 1-like [Lycium barbarum]
MTNSGGSNCSSYSLGFRYRPHDDELINYLIKFVCDKSIECDDIQHIDLYGNKKPSDIFGDLCDASYFFTQLKKKSSNGKNFNRRVVGGGTWKGLDRGKSILNKKGSVIIGFKKSYRFYDKDSNSDQRIVWIMKEYFLSGTILKGLKKRRQIQHEDYVLCRITRKVAVHGDHDQNNGSICASINSDHNEAENIGLMSCVRQNQVNILQNPQEIMNPVFEQPMDQVIVDDQNKGFCANYAGYENIGSSCLQYENQVKVCSNTHEINPMEITNPVFEEPILEYQNQDIDYVVPQEQMETGCYYWLPSNIPNYPSSDQDQYNYQLPDEQEQFERAKASVPSVEESLSELNNLLYGNNDEYNSLLHNLVPTQPIVEFSEQRVLQGINMMMSTTNEDNFNTSSIICSEMQVNSALFFSNEECWPMEEIWDSKEIWDSMDQMNTTDLHPISEQLANY